MSRLNSKVLCAFALGVAAGIAGGCQTYDFEPVQPVAIAQTTQSKTVIARKLKPNLMLLVDKSGSMNEQVGNSGTRMDHLRSAMTTFLNSSGTVARMGMAAYPIDAECSPPTSVSIELNSSNDDEQSLQQTAGNIRDAINSLVPSGGTPTGLSLRMLGNYPPLQNPDRDDFVLLLTDGLPNCNDANPNSCANPQACRCTLANAACGNVGDKYCVKGCLDKTGAKAEVTALLAKQIRTIVVGFGAELATSDGAEVLNELAEAGGFARACPTGTDAECGVGDTCDPSTKLCGKKYYQAANATELAEALRQISDLVGNEKPCEYQLDEVPSDPRFLSVLVNGEVKTVDVDYTYSAGKVTFLGQICTDLENATPSNPIDVEFRIVQGL